MMLLGIVIHAACAYAHIPDSWWYYDPDKSTLYDLIILFIHFFRMPLFYVMAGFFGALLLERRGLGGFLQNRAMRIALPFVVFMVLLFPPMRFLDEVSACLMGGRPDPLGQAVEFVLSGRFAKRIFFMHLWFLQYLIYLTAAAAALIPLLERPFFRRAREVGSAWFRRTLLSRWRALVFALPTLATMLMMKHGVLDGPRPWPLDAHILGAYAVFYFFGWALYKDRDVLPERARWPWAETAWGAVVGAAGLRLAGRQLEIMPAKDSALVYATAACSSLACWLLIFGLTGLFLRYLNRPSRAMRYLSDSAYWLYLVHPLVLVTAQLAIREASCGPHAKFLFVMAVSTPVLLASYHHLVRSTWAGALLNGRRHPRMQDNGCTYGQRNNDWNENSSHTLHSGAEGFPEDDDRRTEGELPADGAVRIRQDQRGGNGPGPHGCRSGDAVERLAAGAGS